MYTTTTQDILLDCQLQCQGQNDNSLIFTECNAKLTL